MTQPDSPAAELRAAAQLLRVPLALPFELALSDLLETSAEYYRPGFAHPTHVVRALAVARALLGSQP